MMKAFFPGEPIWAMLVAPIVMAPAGAGMLRVSEEGPPARA